MQSFSHCLRPGEPELCLRRLRSHELVRRDLPPALQQYGVPPAAYSNFNTYFMRLGLAEGSFLLGLWIEPLYMCYPCCRSSALGSDSSIATSQKRTQPSKGAWAEQQPAVQGPGACKRKHEGGAAGQRPTGSADAAPRKQQGQR